MVEVQIKTHSSTDSEMLARAIVLGIALGLCVGLLICLVRRHPEKARALLISFMSVEVPRLSFVKFSAVTLQLLQALLILRICYDILDFATESEVFASLEGIVSSSRLIVDASRGSFVLATLLCTTMLFSEVLPKGDAGPTMPCMLMTALE